MFERAFLKTASYIFLILWSPKNEIISKRVKYVIQLHKGLEMTV